MTAQNTEPTNSPSPGAGAWSSLLTTWARSAKVPASVADALVALLGRLALDADEQAALEDALDGHDPVWRARLSLGRSLRLSAERPAFPRARRHATASAALLTAAVFASPEGADDRQPALPPEANDLLARHASGSSLPEPITRFVRDVRDVVALSRGRVEWVQRVRRLLETVDALDPFVLDVRVDASLRVGGRPPGYGRDRGKKSVLTLRNRAGRLLVLAADGRSPRLVGGTTEAARVRETLDALTRCGRDGQIELVSDEEGQVRPEPPLRLSRRAREAAELLDDLESFALPPWARRRSRRARRRAGKKVEAAQPITQQSRIKAEVARPLKHKSRRRRRA
jgi:hypothetical protein